MVYPAAAYAHLELGLTGGRLGRYGEAHTHLHHALDLYTQAGDQVWQANIHLTLSYLWDSRAN